MTDVATTYGSKDFAKVASKTTYKPPSKLIHRDVFASTSSEAAAFNAERQHPVHIVDLPTKTISMTIGVLEPGQSTRRHRHNYETVIYVTQGSGYSIIENDKVEWSQGDAIYVPVWAWHSHHNPADSKLIYVAAENAPLLLNLGNIALREECHDN